MCLNYFKDSEEPVSGVCRILSTGYPSLPFPRRSPQGPRSGGITSGKFLKSAASQSPSKNCRAADVGKNATRRRVSRIILASVVNASSRRRRGSIFRFTGDRCRIILCAAVHRKRRNRTLQSALHRPIVLHSQSF